MTAAPPNPYLRTQVLTASPAELQLMLFDGAIRFAEQAKAGMERKDFEAVYTGITRCQAILTELINALRPEHDSDLCDRLSSLYTFMFTRLIAAGTEKDPRAIEEVLGLLRYERETWKLLLDKLASENLAAQQMTDAPNMQAANPEAGGVSPGLIGGIISVNG